MHGSKWPYAVLSLALALGAVAPFGCSASPSSSEPVDVEAEAAPPAPPKPPPTGEPVDPPASGPTRLSETGLYADLAAKTLAPGVLRFAPAHPLWADGAEKERFFLLPPGTKIDTSDMDNWVFPVGTKMWKSFRIGGKLVETRLLWKRDGKSRIQAWWNVAYVWEADGSDAIAKPDGVLSALGTTHDVPNQDDCVLCHAHVRDAIIGFSAIELSSPSAGFADAGTGDAGNSAGAPGTGLLLSFAKQGLFTNPPSADFAVPGTGITRDAIAYMHGNCGFCHKKDGQLQDQTAMRLRLLTTDTTAEQTGAQTTPIRLKMRHVMPPDIDEAVVPGQPEKSQLYQRMLMDNVRMPPKGTKIVDPVGSALIRDWILALPP